MEQTAYLNSYDQIENSGHFIDEESLLPSDLLCEVQENEKFESLEYFLQSEASFLVSQMKTHKGSLFLQNLLEEIPQCELDPILEKLSPHLINIMCSHYGNYFIQKLFQKITMNQRLFILEMIKNNFAFICTDNSGTHSIQALIEVTKLPKEKQIIEELLQQNLLMFFNNSNSNHIIQKIIIDYPESKRVFINKFFIENLDKIITNESGLLCAFKFVIMNTTQSNRASLIQKVSQILETITNNSSGCLFILFLIEKFGYAPCSLIMNEIKNYIFNYGLRIQFSLIIERLFGFIYIHDTEYFFKLSNSIFTNKNCLMYLSQSQNGMKMLFAIIKHFNPTQRLLYKKGIEERFGNLNNQFNTKPNSNYFQIIKLL